MRPGALQSRVVTTTAPSFSTRSPGDRLVLTAVVFIWGFQAIVAQTLLLREGIILLSGSELAWGIILSAWLLGVAVGAVLGRWSVRRIAADTALALVLVALSFAVPACLWLLRGARPWLGVAPGEMVPPSGAAAAALLFITPVASLVGLAFPLACQVQGAAGAGALAGIYAVESLGALVGGAAFSFWAVEHLRPIQSAFVSGAATMATAALLLAAKRHHRIGAVVLAATAGVACSVAVHGGKPLDRRLVERRWRTIAPGQHLRDERESRYQNLALGQRDEQFTLFLDGQATAGFPDPYTFVPLAHFWMCQHPAPNRVLLLGGGAEGLLAEILKHPVEHIDYIEPDPQQIEIVQPWLPEADQAALTDPRVTVHSLDARYFIKTQRDRFDLVIARLAEPTSALRARFYTEEFYGELRRAMREGAVLCTTAAATPATLTAEAAEYVATLRATMRRHFSHVTVSWGDPALIIAATSPNLTSFESAELMRRYSQRGVVSSFFDPAWFRGATDWFDPAKIRQRASELDAAGVSLVCTDLRPIVYVQRLAIWERMTGGPSARTLDWLRSVRQSYVAVALFLMILATLASSRLTTCGKQGWAHGAVIVSMGTTGFATMALTIIWLFAFQNLYGFVYERIGWITALFMGGLVVGATWIRRRPVRDAMLAASLPLVLPLLGAVQGSTIAFRVVEWTVSAGVGVTGILCGAAFGLAGFVRATHLAERDKSKPLDQTAAAAGVVGADHLGACLGALLTGVLLVPVYGTVTAALLVTTLKLISALTLIGLRSSSRPSGTAVPI